MQHPEALRQAGLTITNDLIWVEGLAQDDSEHRSNVANERQRFELWASNLGLHHTGHSSLDYRLRDSKLVFDYALSLLVDLERAVQQFRKSFVEYNKISQKLPHDTSSSSGNEVELLSEDDSDEEDLSSYQIEPPTKALFRNIVSTIDKLYRLAFKIRNPALRLGFSKAVNYSQKDPETGRDLIEEYAEFDLRHMEEIFHSFGDENHEIDQHRYLVERLAKANTRRRQQFLYWKKRRAKYEAFERPTLKEDALAGTPEPVELATDPPPAQIAPSISKPSTATWLNPEKVDFDESGSVMSSSSTIFSISKEQDGDQVILPPAPTLHASAKEFECPFCFTICPRKTTEKKAWEKHVFRDLRPYICTYEDCRDHEQQYDSLRDWNEHEVLHQSVSDAESRTVSSSQTRDCSICHMKNIGPSHVAHHLRRIASFALPRLSGYADSLDSTSQISDGARVDSDSTGGPTIGSVSTAQENEGINETSRRELAEDDIHDNADQDSLISLREEDDRPSQDTDQSDDQPQEDTEAKYELAMSHVKNDQPDQALILLEELATTASSMLDLRDPHRLKYEHQLGKILSATGDPQRAVDLLESVISIGSTTLGEAHPDLLRYKHDLANAYLSTGDFDTAVQLSETVVAMEESINGEDHPVVLASKHELATIYQVLDQRERGIKLLEGIIPKLEEQHGADHPHVTSAMVSLGGIHSGHGQRDQAIELFEKAVAILDKSPDGLHSRMGAHAELADLYQRDGQVSKMIALREHIIAVHEANLVEGRPRCLTAMKDLAQAYRDQGRVKKGIELLQRVIEIQKKTLHNKHPDLLITQSMLDQTSQEGRQMTETKP